MNNQELINYCNVLKENKNRFINCIDVDRIIDRIKQLDEPEKVKVPQCVADWIEYCKVKKITLAHALYRSEEAENKNVFSWIVKDSGNQETFARAWLDGYEVEKEKRYRVKIKGEIEGNLLVYGLGIKRYFFARTYDSSKRGEHTRKQLEEAGFGWVFDCPGIEIEEVER